jgi:hypothetical protein
MPNGGLSSQYCDPDDAPMAGPWQDTRAVPNGILWFLWVLGTGAQ